MASAAIFHVPSAGAGDLALNTASTNPVETANADGNGPGNIKIQVVGSVAVTGPVAVTINSSNTVSVDGAVSNSQESNATGVLISTTQNGVANNITGDYTMLGSISVQGPATPAAGTDYFNTGIKVQGQGTFTGNITVDALGTTTETSGLSGAMVVGGHRATGILIAAPMIGNVTHEGTISITGDNGHGIATTAPLTGNLNVAQGVISVGGAGAIGIYNGGAINGSWLMNGTVTVGTGPVVTSTNGVTLVTLDPTPARAGAWVAGNITGGMFMQGNRLTRSQEAIDPTTAAAATPADSAVAVVGPVGILVTQGGLNATPSNIVISGGTATDGWSFKNNGNVLVDGTVKGLSATGINIHGMAVGGQVYTTLFADGIWNDRGNIEVAATDTTAIGVNIGAYGTVSRFQNDGDIIVDTVDSTASALTGRAGTQGGNSYGIIVDAQGSLPSFVNTGNIVVKSQGGAFNATALVDRSGSLTSFNNSGLINTEVQLGSTGKITSVDLSANTTGVNFTNTGTIIGEVRLGAGNNTLNIIGKDASLSDNIIFQAGATKTGNNTILINGGVAFGTIELGNGNHTVYLVNGARIVGGLGQGTGAITLGVDASQITLSGQRPIVASSGSFTNGSTLTFDIDNSAASLPGGILQSTSGIHIDATSRVTAKFTGLIDGEKVITAIKAPRLQLDAPLSTLASTPASYLNTAAFSLAANDPNTLLLTVRRKTATELGLGTNRSAIYNAFTTALNNDTPVVTALSALTTKEEFEGALAQMMPDTSGAVQQAAINNQDMAAGAIRRRLVGVAKNGMPDHAAGDIASFWTQALGDYSDQKPRGEQAGFDIWGLGIAFGADVPVFDGSTIVGIGFTETWHSANLQVAARSPVEFYNTQAALYFRYSGDSFYVQGNAGGGYNSYSQERRVTVGNVSRLALGKWKGFEFGGVVESGYILRAGNYQVVPFVRAAYQRNHENAYTETGGGTGIDLTVSARNPKNARASAGFTLDRDFPIYYDSYIEAEFRANYTREVLNDPYSLTAQFAVGPSFTNTSLARSPNRANVGFGFAHKDSYSSVSVDYDAEIASGYIAHKAALTARFRF